MFSTTGSVHTLKVFGTCESGGYLSESSYNLIKFRSILPVDKYFYKSCTKSAVTVFYQVSCHCLVPSQLSVSCTKSAVTVLYQVSCHCLVPSQLSLSCTKSAVTVLYQVSCHCLVPSQLSLYCLSHHLEPRGTTAVRSYQLPLSSVLQL